MGALPTRRAVTKEEFEQLDNLVFQVEYNHHLYDITKAYMDDSKVSGLIGLIDIPIGEQGLRDLLAMPQYRISTYCMKYDDLEDAKKLLEGRMKRSGETQEIIQDRIKKARHDQNELESYQDIFKDVFLVKEWKKGSSLGFDGFLANYIKKMI